MAELSKMQMFELIDCFLDGRAYTPLDLVKRAG